MAKQKEFIDERGVDFAKSYWRPVQITFSIADKTGSALFYGYKDKKARDDNKQPVGQKFYSVLSAQYEELLWHSSN